MEAAIVRLRLAKLASHVELENGTVGVSHVGDLQDQEMEGIRQPARNEDPVVMVVMSSMVLTWTIKYPTSLLKW
ncbi:hypothetical protein Hanom_Chr03g00181621 [Helianthus anomalus]